MTTPSTTPDETGRFLELLRRSLGDGALVQLILGKYRGTEDGMQRVLARPVAVKEGRRLSLVYRYATKDVTKNVTAAEAPGTVRGLLESGFRSAHLFTTAGDALLEFNKRGEPRLTQSRATREAAADGAHNREKQRLLDPAAPFLRELGVTDENGHVLPSMSRKWKQINVFLEIFQGALAASPLAKAKTVRVVDFGSGKGYLTFAVYDYLCGIVGGGAQVTGIELRPELVAFCNAAARKTGMANLHFSEGDVNSVAPERIDVMIALHACDTATDLAIHTGIRAGAAVILCAPCCHKEIRPQMTNPEVLRPVLRFGIQQAQEAEMVTDSIRALLLEACDYEAQIFEFVALEHTAKNKMILAVKREGPARRDEALARLKALKAFYGIREQCLERLLLSTD